MTNSQLDPVLYAKLRKIARRQLARERPGHTLDSGALVNEAFLHVLGQGELTAKDRSHFVAIWAQVMRRILVDHARARNARKRGGPARAVSLDEAELPTISDGCRLLALEAALQGLAAVDAQAASIVEQRYFAGATESDVSQALGISQATVRRRWAFAKAWLRRELA